ncbi:hypothetical protein RIF29_25283 [Crotalaria pallida]|uniref:Protein kinase domain-containing protein n=1 Tax=Crotalaria pallida TaxID=3830 RepID=A0AAN9ENH2_CROPI
MMSTEPQSQSQRVVVIQNASRDVSAKAIQKALRKLSLKAGDQLIIVAILDWFNSPSTFSFFRRKRLGYMMSVDSTLFVSTNKKIIEELLTKKKEDYSTHNYLAKLIQYCKDNKIVFQIEVLPGPAPETAFTVARNIKATSVILDRQMHKDKRFMDRIPCGIYRITSNNSIEKLKEPASTSNTKSLAERADKAEEELSLRSRSSSSDQFMSTGVSSHWSTEASGSSLGGSQYDVQKDQDEKFLINIEQQETAMKQSLFYVSDNPETSQIDVNQEQHSSNTEVSHTKEEFENSLCSVCNNRRPKVGWKRDFSYAELYNATQGFSAKNFLSEGGYGSVYKGYLKGVRIAVKQHKSASFQGEKEFKSEVRVLSKARHENVVMLLGSCSEGNNRLLVYEYVCNGSLDQHLSEHSRSPLSWEDRIKVATGVAKGLLYLHKNSIIHRDMRPNNILITHDHEPLLGDFGLAKTQNQDSIHSTEVVGTLGYLAPEYAEYGKVSTKIDVYSFGVILLQLITGLRTTDKRLGGRTLVGWARPLLRERNYPDLIDERITNFTDFHQLFWMVRLAEKCLSRDPKKRLDMAVVVDALSIIVEGSTCNISTRGYSPSMSDSFYSELDSDESEDDLERSLESELDTESTTSCSISQMNQMFIRQPPSPPIQSIS